MRGMQHFTAVVLAVLQLLVLFAGLQLLVLFAGLGCAQGEADPALLDLQGAKNTHCFSTGKVTWLNGKEGRVFMRDDIGGLHQLRLKGVSWHG